MEKLLDFTRPHILRNEAEYEAAVREIDSLLDRDPPEGSADYDRLEFLSVLVEDYEDEHVRVPATSPQDAVDFMLEQKGMSRSDLSELMGGKSRVSEFFSGKRGLSRTQVQRLRARLGIPADVLLGFGSG